MRNNLKRFLKKISPVPLSRNQRYDRLTKRILNGHLSPQSNCIDAGCYQGEILDIFLKLAPEGNHFAFEPVPVLFDNLRKKYAGYPNCKVFNYALGNSNGETSYNYVVTNPAYSGIRKRKYAGRNERVEEIRVPIRKLDELIPAGTKIDFIKIDVEGGEFDVLKGAEKIIMRDRPFVVFEFGIGAADLYETRPEELFQFLNERKYEISLMDQFLAKKKSLTIESFAEQFNNKLNYYFIAHPGV